MTKTCKNCGVEFPCGLSCCWCDEVTLDPATRAELQQRFTDCLCRVCLEEAAAQAASSAITNPLESPVADS